MDVSSMLNASSAAAGQSEPLEAEKTPYRRRTPWDAGGYSLPINTRIAASPINNAQHNEAPSEYPADSLSKHGVSLSRGSMSSFASSATSATHSRFSSASTVSGFQPFSSIDDISEDVPKDSSGTRAPSWFSSPFSPSSHARLHQALPSIESLDALVRIAEHRLRESSPEESPQREATATRINSRYTTGRVEGKGMVFSSRAGSPSDAIMIRRPSYGLHHGNADSLDVFGQDSFERHQDSRVFESHSGRRALQSKAHKRAFSAPDFQADKNDSGQLHSEWSAPSGYMNEPTPPLSHRPEDESPRNSVPQSPINYPSEYTPPVEGPASTQVVCMFIDNCDTGSPVRKVVSHVFGRNKMCTRLIPAHTWVSFCRKHYQRSRYREPKNWPRSQCDLVQKQIQRLEEWSDGNLNRGEGGVIRDWELAVRKREQKRLEDLAVSGVQNGEPDDTSSKNDSSTKASSTSTPATAVPDWIRSICRKGYTTHEIKEIFNRLHQELLDSSNPVFPDIEILPNIMVDYEVPKSPIGYAKRNAVPAPHKRSQSMGVALSSGNMPGRHLPQKRKRGEEHWAEDMNRYPVSQGQNIRIVERSSERDAKDVDHFTQLPAPIPQRHNTRPTAAHLDSNMERSEIEQRSRGNSISHQYPQSHLSTENLVGQMEFQEQRRYSQDSVPRQLADKEWSSHSISSRRQSLTRTSSSHSHSGHMRHYRHQSSPMITRPLMPGDVKSREYSLPLGHENILQSNRMLNDPSQGRMIFTPRR